MRDQQRQWVKFPSAFKALRIPIQIISDAIFAQKPPGSIAPGLQFRGSQPAEGVKQREPMCARRSLRNEHFVINTGGWEIITQKSAGLGFISGGWFRSRHVERNLQSRRVRQL